MNRSLNESLRTVQVLEPVEDSSLQVFGLRWQSESRLRYATLDEAMGAGSLEVMEINESGSVPTLKVTNKADQMAFLMAGEQLIGAKQNRILNVSMMIPAATTLNVPVSCVEAGRWRQRSAKFASGGSMSHGTLRKMLSAQTRLSYQSGGSPTSDQGAVWDEVSRKLGAMGSASASQAFHQVYLDHAARLDDLAARIRPPEGCHGVAFALAGTIAGADLFDHAETLSKLWTKLVRAYALDAMEPRESTSARVTTDDVSRWVSAAAGAKAESFPSPGLGLDLRLESDALIGSALVVDEEAVHVELFADVRPAGS
jgi:hypothetical protein